MGKSVLVVEDNLEMAKTFAYSISGVATLSLIAMVHTVAEAKSFLAARPVDVCLVDLGLPDGSGLEVISFASNQPKPPHILVCTVFGDEKNIIASIEAGANGYVLKDALTSNVASDIETLLAGGSALSPAVARILLTRLRPPVAPAMNLPLNEQVHLSPREHEVLSLIARGCTYLEVAKALSISDETVSAHLRNTYKKLSVHSRTEAIYEAGRLGILKVN
jgi:DNA-binding NarL/FixJ family response regulator